MATMAIPSSYIGEVEIEGNAIEVIHVEVIELFSREVGRFCGLHPIVVSSKVNP